MKKVLFSIFIMSFVLLFTVDVKADEYWNVYSTIQKGNNSNELYNEMPTEVKRGDIIPVRLSVKGVQGWLINSGSSEITYDKAIFEPVEVEGKFYKKLNDNVVFFNVYYERTGIVSVSYVWGSNNESDENSQDIVEIYFRVKEDIKDGVYQISHTNGTLSVVVNDTSGAANIENKVLQFQIGKPKLKSLYSADNIESSTYIIGNYLFTRSGSDEYNGTLTTEYIMLAAKSIEGDAKDDMIIYTKNALGTWKNAITNENITPPSNFDITNVNMKASYPENGVYADDLDKTIVRLIQINESEVLITIETEQETIHGIATISNGVATLTVSNVTYRVNISSSGVTIETSDPYIIEKDLEKRANYTLSDYLRNTYNSDSINYYKNSSQTGAYRAGSKTIYFLRLNDDYARVCIKENTSTGCDIDHYVYSPDMYGPVALDDAEYLFQLDEEEYGFNFVNGNMLFRYALGDLDVVSTTLSKVSSISDDDILRIWENNKRIYRVTFDPNNGEESTTVDVKAGDIVRNNLIGWYEIEEYTPYYADHEFVEWQLNGVAYDFDAPVTAPMVLVAKYNTVIKHNVVFNTGSSTLQVEVSHGSTVERPIDPTKDKYVFIEWQLNGSTYDFSTPVVEDITLTALWGSFDGVYSLDNQTIKLYTLSGGVIRGYTTGDSINGIISDRIENDGVITLELGNVSHPLATYNISINGGNIMVTSDGDAIPTGEYTRVSDYAAADLYEDYYAANADYLEDETYNKIATIAQTNGILTLYMFKTNANEVTVYIKDSSQVYLSRERLTIENDGSLSLRDTNNKLILTVTMELNNINVAKYNEEGTEIDINAYITGSYTAQSAITIEDIINNVS